MRSSEYKAAVGPLQGPGHQHRKMQHRSQPEQVQKNTNNTPRPPARIAAATEKTMRVCDPRTVRRRSRDLLRRAHKVQQGGAQATAREHDRRAKRKQCDKVEGQIIRRARDRENPEHDHRQTRERLNAC